MGKSYSFGVVDFTARIGLYALEQLGLDRPAETGWWQNIRSPKLPSEFSFDWQRVGAKDPIHASDEATCAIAILIGPGAISRFDALREFIAALSAPVWIFLSPSALAEEIAIKSWPKNDLVSVLRLPDSDPKTVWFMLLDKVVSLVEADRFFNLDEDPRIGDTKLASNLEQSMQQIMSIDGAMAAALVDYRSGMCLSKAGTALNLDLAAAGNTQVVRAKLQTVETLGLRRGIEDILITLVDQYHLIRLVPNHQGLFLYLVLDKNKGNLALARYKLSDIERVLSV